MPDLMLIHGLGDNKLSVQPFINAMDGPVGCWAGDLLGHGDRPLPEKFSMELMAEDLVQGMEQVGIDRPYLFGHSFGGRVALYVARHYPDHVRGVCLLGTRYGVTVEDRWLTVAYYDPESPRVQALPEKQRALFGIIRDWLIAKIDDPPAFSDEDLRRIQAPVLILGGTADPIVSPEDQARMHELLPNNRFVLFEGTAHPLWMIPFQGIAGHVIDFVRAVEAGSE